MGKGNCCVHGAYEGLYYIDNDDYVVYRFNDPYAEEPEVRLQGDLSNKEISGNDWLYDEEGTMCEENDVLECFMEGFAEAFPDFKQPKSNEWLDGCNRIIMESDLFYIAVEDNEWSLAVKLLQKEDKDDSGDEMEGRQMHLYQKYLEGMKVALLNRLPSIGCYDGPWTSRIIKREEVK